MAFVEGIACSLEKVYDFSKAKRGAVIPTIGKTRITIYMDDAILKRFKAQSEKSGKGYQTLINEALSSYLGLTEPPVTRDLVRKIVREELAAQSPEAAKEFFNTIGQEQSFDQNVPASRQRKKCDFAAGLGAEDRLVLKRRTTQTAHK